jgi:hypothetical protein
MSIAMRSQDNRLGGVRRLPGPVILFGLGVAATAAAFAIGSHRLPATLLLSLVVTLLFVLAAVTALLASLLREPNRRRGITYWDVAGALTLIGVVASAAIEPEQLVALIEGQRDR